MSVEIIIAIPDRVAPDNIGAVVDHVVANIGLNVTLRGTLKSYPGSSHWHFKRGHEPGTLELTWWPQHRKLWIKIQARRTAPWMDKIVPRFKREIESGLRKTQSPEGKR